MISNCNLQQVPFSKYSGSGNDFILIDNRKNIFPKTDKNFIQQLCRRSLGIGADGIILLETSVHANYRMRIYNADGGEAEMCGNGLRCLARFIQELKIPGNTFLIEVSNAHYKVSAREHGITVEMPPPSLLNWDVLVNYQEQSICLDYLDTGVPHVVSFVDDVEAIELEKIGPYLRHNTRFAPKGANVNFASRMNANTFCIRTYERGVEGETLACGTGATAVAVAAERKFHLTGPIIILTRSKEKIEFTITKQCDKITEITMQGPAKKIYSGVFETEKLLNATPLS